MVQCICQICICGRHQCEHTRNRVPYAKGEYEVCKVSEHKDRFRAFCCQPRAQPIIPVTNDVKWTGSEPAVKISTTKRDYVSHPLQKRTLKKTKAYKEPKGKFYHGTTYKSDYKPKHVEVRSKFKTTERTKDGTMPGTLPGKFESETTYGRNYIPKVCPPREQAKVQGCTLTKLGQPFSGTTETKSCYQPPTYSKREMMLPRTGEHKFSSGSFDGQTTHKTDFPAKYVEPAKPIKKMSKWKPSSDKFEGTTTHAHDYKCPPLAPRRTLKIQKEGYEKPEGSFEGISSYKKDFQAHDVSARKLPAWHPGSRPYKKSDAPPMTAQTTYKTDFEPPPEDLLPPKSKQIKNNISIPEGTMESVTSSMRDYRKIDHPVITKSCKPDTQYKKPEGEFADCTTTKCDYTAKTGDRVAICRISDNIELKKGSMEDLSTTMRDYQWTSLDCPAKYLKKFGKDALPDYQFVDREKGHDYFKKLKMKKSRL